MLTDVSDWLEELRSENERDVVSSESWDEEPGVATGVVTRTSSGLESGENFTVLLGVLIELSSELLLFGSDGLTSMATPTTVSWTGEERPERRLWVRMRDLRHEAKIGRLLALLVIDVYIVSENAKV